MYPTVKRFLDLLFAVVLSIALSPLLLLTALAIKLESKGPALFRQDRLGLGGKPFTILKFRSMVLGAEKQGTGVYSYRNDARVTRVGHIIRKTSIDELPQLFNIIKGEMSFIGPRPTLTYHPWPIDEYTAGQLRRFTVRPGVTGWAQVNGRKDLPWDIRMQLDVEYVAQLSFPLDFKIFLLTVKKVFAMADNYNITETALTAGVPPEEKSCR